MYHVTVLNAETGAHVDSFEMPFGQWIEIGYALDSCGYNDPGFKLEITFSEGPLNTKP